jgi:iron complex outermembrane receptor protein
VGGAATVDDGETWFAPLPSATLTYELAPGHKVYGSVSRGYRVGDFTANEVGAATIGKGYTVDPEFTLTSELGYKGEAAGGRLRFSTAVYHIDWDDMQVNAVVGGQQLRQNAGKAHSDGVEGEVAWAAAPGLDLFATASWMRAVFDEYENHPTGDPTGKRIPNTNECTVGAGGTYHHASGFFVAADATWFGEKYLDELNNIKQDPYLLGNARVGYKADGWSVAVFGRNLGDVRYLVRAYEIMAGVNAGVVGEPMSFGVEGLYTF